MTTARPSAQRRYCPSIQARAASRLAAADERLRAALQADCHLVASMSTMPRREGQDTRAIVLGAMHWAAEAHRVREQADAAAIEHQAALHDAARVRRTKPAERRKRFRLVEGA